MVHDINVEERLFCADIQALCNYDDGFNEAWESGATYQLVVNLSELYTICPRKYQRTLMYGRLVRFLKTKNITLTVVSQKNKLKNEVL